MTRLNGREANDAARVIEELFADLAELRELRDRYELEMWGDKPTGTRTDVASARVTLLNLLSIATEGDLMGGDETMPDDHAKAMYLSLHTNEATGYERGDCHCDHCDHAVTALVVYFAIEKPETGVYSPAALVREAAVERGWESA